MKTVFSSKSMADTHGCRSSLYCFFELPLRSSVYTYPSDRCLSQRQFILLGLALLCSIPYRVSARNGCVCSVDVGGVPLQGRVWVAGAGASGSRQQIGDTTLSMVVKYTCERREEVVPMVEGMCEVPRSTNKDWPVCTCVANLTRGNDEPIVMDKTVTLGRSPRVISHSQSLTYKLTSEWEYPGGSTWPPGTIDLDLSKPLLRN